jgi:hypothetical protein
MQKVQHWQWHSLSIRPNQQQQRQQREHRGQSWGTHRTARRQLLRA